MKKQESVSVSGHVPTNVVAFELAVLWGECRYMSVGVAVGSQWICVHLWICALVHDTLQSLYQSRDSRVLMHIGAVARSLL